MRRRDRGGERKVRERERRRFVGVPTSEDQKMTDYIIVYRSTISVK